MTRAPARAAIRAMPAAPTHRRPRPESVLEGAAMEFALLAQRRARLRRQIDLLARQAAAADGVMAQVETRMAELARRMGGLVPAAGLPPLPAPPAPPAAPKARRRGVAFQY